MVSESSATRAPVGRSDWREVLATWLVIVVMGGLYVAGSRAFSTRWVVKEAVDYYEYQTEGFVQGHLYAAVEPHPALVRLADPYDPVANAPYRIHDMTYFRGKYYLYFGVAPVILLFLPWRLATGTHLTEPLAATLFCVAGFVIGLLLLRAWRRRYCPDTPLWSWVLLGLAWGLGSGVTVLIQRPVFYHVPIACAFFLLMAALAWVDRACHASSDRGRCGALALAGLCCGLSLAARPNYLLAGFSLLVPVGWMVWVARGRHRPASARTWGLAAAAFGPIVAVGVALMGFNYARFGSVAEFGIRYQLAGERVSSIRLLGMSYIPRNAGYYLFNPAAWSPYFPFFEPGGDQPLGTLRYFPVVWAGLFFLGWRCRVDGAGRAWVVTVLVAGVLNLVMLCAFFGYTDRYPPDFQAALVLAGIGGCLLAMQVSRARVVRATVAVLAGVTCLSGAAVIIHATAARAHWKGFERLVNWPHYAWLKQGGELPGRLRLLVTFAPGQAGETEPLIDTGGEAGWRDFLSLEHLGGGEAQLRFFHAGYGSVVSPKFALEVGRRRELVIAFGGLLPPAVDPYFSGWSDFETEAARCGLRVSVDSTVLFDTGIKAYLARPADVMIGATPRASGNLQPKFRGQILRSVTEPLRREDYTAPDFDGGTALTLALQMPIGREGNAEPLLAAGVPGDGDLLYVKYTERGRVRFGIDHFGAGGPISAEADIKPVGPQELTVWMGNWATGPLRDAPARAAGEVGPAQRLWVRLNGRVLFDVWHPFSQGTGPATVIGANAIGSTAAGKFFTGRAEITGRPAYAALLGSVAAIGWGAVELGVYFPEGRTGASEPLVVSGKAGAGDLVYVRYLDAEHVQFGFDHWGVGGAVSEPVALDYGVAHTLRVDMGSLRGPEAAEAGRDVVDVTLDGRVVLRAKFHCHPTSAEEITIGINRIGGSTAGEKFFGRTLSLRRVAE